MQTQLQLHICHAQVSIVQTICRVKNYTHLLHAVKHTCFTQLHTPAARSYSHLLHAATHTCFTQLHAPASRSYTHLLHAVTHTCFTQLHIPASRSFSHDPCCTLNFVCPSQAPNSSARKTSPQGPWSSHR